jgi:nucleotide-binding universal stress UspA family protein
LNNNNPFKLKKRLSKVLVAIDGSEQSMHAANFAISIARKYEAKLIALYVFYSQLGYAYASYLNKLEDSPSLDAILDSAKQDASQWFNIINYNTAQVNSASDKNRYTLTLENDIIVTSTSISASIIDYAVDNMINLIVIGTRGRSGIKKVLLGSVASEVVRDSRCPVLVVK